MSWRVSCAARSITNPSISKYLLSIQPPLYNLDLTRRLSTSSIAFLPSSDLSETATGSYEQPGMEEESRQPNHNSIQSGLNIDHRRPCRRVTSEASNSNSAEIPQFAAQAY